MPAAGASVVARFTFSSWPSLTQALFEVLMIWGLCTGVIHLAASNASLARAAANARGLTVFAAILNFTYALLFYGFGVAIPHAGSVLLAFGWSVMAIVALVMGRAAGEV